MIAHLNCCLSYTYEEEGTSEVDTFECLRHLEVGHIRAMQPVRHSPQGPQGYKHACIPALSQGISKLCTCMQTLVYPQLLRRDLNTCIHTHDKHEDADEGCH